MWHETLVCVVLQICYAYIYVTNNNNLSLGLKYAMSFDLDGHRVDFKGTSVHWFRLLRYWGLCHNWGMYDVSYLMVAMEFMTHVLKLEVNWCNKSMWSKHWKFTLRQVVLACSRLRKFHHPCNGKTNLVCSTIELFFTCNSYNWCFYKGR